MNRAGLTLWRPPKAYWWVGIYHRLGQSEGTKRQREAARIAHGRGVMSREGCVRRAQGVPPYPYTMQPAAYPVLQACPR